MHLQPLFFFLLLKIQGNESSVPGQISQPAPVCLISMQPCVRSAMQGCQMVKVPLSLSLLLGGQEEIKPITRNCSKREVRGQCGIVAEHVERNVRYLPFHSGSDIDRE